MFGSSSGQYKPKAKVPVEVELDDGTLMMGALFVAGTQRLSDLLNDERQFLPFETSEGTVVSLRKSIIARVSELNQRSAARTENSPYAILGIGEDAGDGEVKRAYRDKVREVHPDKWAGVALPDEAVAAVNTKMARINDAYHRILRARGLRPAAEKGAD
jgi:hypothetical protein